MARAATSIGNVYWDVNVAGLSPPRFAPRKLFRNEPSNAHHKLLSGAGPDYLLVHFRHYACLGYNPSTSLPASRKKISIFAIHRTTPDYEQLFVHCHTRSLLRLTSIFVNFRDYLRRYACLVCDFIFFFYDHLYITNLIRS